MKRNTLTFKLITCVSLASLITLFANAGSQTFDITTGAKSNLISAPLRVTRVVLQAPSGSSDATLTAIDSPNLTTTNIVGAYTYITQKGTNVIQSYTNFFGVATLITNFALISETNTVTSITNSWPQRFSLSVGTNGSALVDNVSYFFTEGLLVTNSGAGTGRITVTWQ